MTILRKRPLTVVALTALFVGAISCGDSTTTGGGASVDPNAPTTPTTPTTPTVTGKIESLTTSIDSLQGSDGNDVFTGDNGNAAFQTMQSGDSIYGNAGYDVFNVHGVVATAGLANMPSATATVKSVEQVRFVTALTGSIDLSSLYSKANNGVELYSFDNVGTAGITITTGADQGLSVASSTSATAAGAVVWAASPVATALNLTFNGYQTNVAAPANFDVTGAAATTLNINSNTAANKVGTFTGPASVLSHKVSGAQSLAYTLSATDAGALNSIDASASTGGVKATLAAAPKAAFTFTGGSGNDTLALVNDGLANIIAGSQLNGGAGALDKLSLADTTVSAAEFAKINAALGFEVLSLNAAVTLTAGSVTSGIKHFAVDTTALTQSITGLPTGSVVDVGVGATAAFSATSLTLAGALGVTDVAVNLGATTDASTHAIPTLVVTGLTNVNIASNGVAANTIGATALTSSANTTFTLSGNAPSTTLGSPAAGAIINGSALTGNFTTSGSTSADIITTGVGNDTVTGLAGGDTVTVGTGADTIAYTAASQSFSGAVTSGVTVLTATDVYTGMIAGDKIAIYAAGTITGATAISTALLSAAGTTDSIALVRGTYNTSTGVFTVSLTGPDTLVEFDSNGTTAAGAIENFVLLGFTGSAVLSADLITLI